MILSTQTRKKLSNCHQCYQTPKMSQGTNQKKNLEKKVFFVAVFLEKTKKLTRITPCHPTRETELFLTSCKNHRYPAGYPATSGRISGIRPPPDIRPNPN